MTYDEVLFEASTLELQSSVVREKSMVVDCLAQTVQHLTKFMHKFF